MEADTPAEENQSLRSWVFEQAMKLYAKDVGKFYDHSLEFWRGAWGGVNVHAGFWPEGEGELSFSEAQELMTDLVFSMLHLDEIKEKAEREGRVPRILDVGSGFGGPAIHLAKMGFQVVGINLSTTQIEESNQAAANEGLTEDQVSFHYLDAMHMSKDEPFLEAGFDAVLGFESLFHMKDRQEVLNRATALLNPGGRIVIADATEKDPHGNPIKESDMDLIKGAFQVNSLANKDEYPHLFENAGLITGELLDISENIKNTLRETKKALEKDEVKDAIIREHGRTLLILMNLLWGRISEIYENQMGYIVIEGEKPA